MAADCYILGIHDGHNASACLLANGRIIAAVSEERLARVKNECGYPRKAIEEVLRIGGVDAQDLHSVALATKFMHHREFYQNWDWYKKGFSEQVQESQLEENRRQYFLEERIRERKLTIVEHLGVDQTKIHIVEHHQAHAAAAYFTSPWADAQGKTLVMTLDGSGDGLCATVGIGERRSISRISATGSGASIGKVYSRITYMLGMKPWEHEYKLMGLAPYADEAGLERSYKVIKPLVDLKPDSLEFSLGTEISTNYCYPYLRAHLENHRFDWIAGAVQRRTEELMCQWVRTAVKKTGIRRLALGGGVFMNVKANMLLLDLPEIEQIWVLPSCGDESVSFGAALTRYYSAGVTPDSTPVRALPDMYLGADFSEADIQEAFKEHDVRNRFRVIEPSDVNKAVATLLAEGKIVARCDGCMEWGARALGNRSILMDPRNIEGVRELNNSIKERDFWMPFAPSLLAEDQYEYIENPKYIDSPYMMLAYRSTPKASRDIPAALHPYDRTARAQLVTAQLNPGYHSLLREFKQLTGVSGVLNTSFNLHGEPLVATPTDAMSVFQRSGLRYLNLGRFIVTKDYPHVES